MTRDEALSFIVQICIRIFELAMVTVYLLARDSEIKNKVLNEHREWLDQKLKEFELQEMIDEMY